MKRNLILKLLAMVVLLAWGSAAGCPAFAQGATRAVRPGAQASSAPAKFALLVGIDDYEYPARVSPLAGAINDVDDMRELLIGKYEFAPANILTLKNGQATHAAIIAAIEGQLIARARAGDIVVFQFSGHGSQMKDASGQMISGLDETIVPYDSRDPAGKVFDISGGELHLLLLRLAAKTRNLTFILDSCHSGTLVRGATVRSVAADTRTPPQMRNLAGGGGGSGDGKAPARFALIAAATSKESAFEHYADGREHGALTYFLTQQLRAAGAGATYRDVMDGVAANVEANYPAQHPSLEGVEGDQTVFGDTTSLSKAYAVASPEPGDAHHVLLGVGQVQGATAGSEYDVYAPGSKLFRPPDVPLARLQIASVGALTSEATVLSGGPIAPASRAVERRHRYGNARLRVSLDGPANSQVLEQIRTALGGVKYVELVSKPALASVVVSLGSDTVAIVAPDQSPLSPPVPVDEAQVIDRVVGQVQQWARWFSVLSLHNVQPEVSLRFILGSKAPSRDAMARVGKANFVANAGEMVSASLTNQGDRDVYVAILDLASDGSISVLYPGVAGAQEVLKPGATLTRSFRAFVPNGNASVDVLKAFASYRPIDLRPLTMRAIRSLTDFNAAPDELGELLTDAAGDTRSAIPLLAKPTDLGTWNTVQQTLTVQKPG